MGMLGRFVLFVAIVFTLVAPRLSQAATVPAGFIDETFVQGLNLPNAMAFAPDGRLFVCEQGGALRVVVNGVLQATPFVTLNVSSLGERGLVGVAIDPNFASNGFIYVFYTSGVAPIHNRVSRLTANGNLAAPASEVVLLDFEPVGDVTDENGGALQFGKDGKLYVGVGESTDMNNAQSFANRFGKVLRVNADGSVPADNPFVNSASGVNRAIWAFGLRNPYTMAFQPGTSRLFINDVGQSSWEEIDNGIAGANYGWPQTEGATTATGITSPLYAYDHSAACAITGGTFYNSAVATFPALYSGKYFFADFCAGWIQVFDPSTMTAGPFATGVSRPVSLAVGSEGALYYVARASGTVGRIRAVTAPSVPSVGVAGRLAMAILLLMIGITAVRTGDRMGRRNVKRRTGPTSAQ